MHAVAQLLTRVLAGTALVALVVVATPTRTTPAAADFTPIGAQAALAALRASTVEVFAFGCSLERDDGTAVAIGDGRLLTNAHVVAGSRLIDIAADDAATQVAGEAFVATAGDVAVLGDSGNGRPGLALATEDPAAGSTVRVGGFPAGGPGFTMVTMQVTDYVAGRGLGEPWPVMRLTESVRPGMSGGAVLDAAGRLAGIVFGNELPDGRALAVPASQLRRLLVTNAFTPLVSC